MEYLFGILEIQLPLSVACGGVWKKKGGRGNILL
jgi:hypothetical protein